MSTYYSSQFQEQVESSIPNNEKPLNSVNLNLVGTSNYTEQMAIMRGAIASCDFVSIKIEGGDYVQGEAKVMGQLKGIVKKFGVFQIGLTANTFVKENWEQKDWCINVREERFLENGILDDSIAIDSRKGKQLSEQGFPWHQFFESSINMFGVKHATNGNYGRKTADPIYPLTSFLEEVLVPKLLVISTMDLMYLFKVLNYELPSAVNELTDLLNKKRMSFYDVELSANAVYSDPAEASKQLGSRFAAFMFDESGSYVSTTFPKNVPKCKDDDAAVSSTSGSSTSSTTITSKSTGVIPESETLSTDIVDIDEEEVTEVETIPPDFTEVEEEENRIVAESEETMPEDFTEANEEVEIAKAISESEMLVSEVKEDEDGQLRDEENEAKMIASKQDECENEKVDSVKSEEKKELTDSKRPKEKEQTDSKKPKVEKQKGNNSPKKNSKGVQNKTPPSSAKSQKPDGKNNNSSSNKPSTKSTTTKQPRLVPNGNRPNPSIPASMKGKNNNNKNKKNGKSNN